MHLKGINNIILKFVLKSILMIYWLIYELLKNYVISCRKFKTWEIFFSVLFYYFWLTVLFYFWLSFFINVPFLYELKSESGIEIYQKIQNFILYKKIQVKIIKLYQYYIEHCVLHFLVNKRLEKLQHIVTFRVLWFICLKDSSNAGRPQ